MRLQYFTETKLVCKRDANVVFSENLNYLVSPGMKNKNINVVTKLCQQIDQVLPELTNMHYLFRLSTAAHAPSSSQNDEFILFYF